MFRYENRVKIPIGEVSKSLNKDLDIKDYFENIGQFNNYSPSANTEKSKELKLIEFSMRSRDDLETVLPESLQYMKNEIIYNFKEHTPLIKKENDSSKRVLIMPIVLII